MKQIKTKSGNILCVEVLKNAYDFELISQGYHLRYKTGGFNHITGADNIKDIDIRNNLNNPKFVIIGKLSKLTDKDCEEFVEALNSVYLDYLNPDYAKADYTNEWGCNSTKESFISLLQSEGMDTSKEFLIIKIL